MHAALLCAAHRGYLFLERLSELLPHAELTVVSFREEPWEPPFLDDIAALAAARGARFFEAKHVGADPVRAFWDSTPVDLAFAVSWRYIVPSHVFRRPRLGTFVFHDSLLPEYRGFSPTVWAIINGEDHTGVTLFEMSEEVDAGDIVAQERVPIGPDEPIGVVLERVTATYLRLLEQHLGALLTGRAPRRPQDHARATYTCKRLPEDNRIDWTAPARRIYDLIRAVGPPYPGAYTSLAGQRLTVWGARGGAASRRYVGAVPGRVVGVRPGEGSVVLTGTEPLLLTSVQLESGPATCAADVLNRVGSTLGG